MIAGVGVEDEGGMVRNEVDNMVYVVAELKRGLFFVSIAVKCAS